MFIIRKYKICLFLSLKHFEEFNRFIKYLYNLNNSCNFVYKHMKKTNNFFFRNYFSIYKNDK